MNEINISAFSYGDLEPGVAGIARKAAHEIRESQHRFIEDVVAIGRNLIRVKDLLPHGEFGKWLGSEFAMSSRTAERYMQAAKAFGPNPTRVSCLPLRVIYALAAEPAQTRERVLELSITANARMN